MRAISATTQVPTAKYAPTQAKHRSGEYQRGGRCAKRRDRQHQPWIEMICRFGDRKQRIGTDADKDMLPDGNHSAVASQQVPSERNCKQRERPRPAAARWRNPRTMAETQERTAAATNPIGSPLRRIARILRRCRRSVRTATPLVHSSRLPVEKAVGARQQQQQDIRCPKNGPRPDEIRAPNSCATPITSPPARVPHRLPRPPSTTASNE